MAYAMEVDGMAEISEMLNQMEENAQGTASRALYEGARVMGEAIQKEIETIKTAPFKYAKSGEKRLPSPEEKAVLEEHGIGIAKFDKDGLEINTSVGVDTNGYVDVNFSHMNSEARTNYKSVHLKGRESNSSALLKAIGNKEKGQNQKPLGVIANAINSGTTFMEKQPFIRKAEKTGGQKAMQAMKDSIERDFDAMTK